MTAKRCKNDDSLQDCRCDDTEALEILGLLLARDLQGVPVDVAEYRIARRENEVV